MSNGRSLQRSVEVLTEATKLWRSCALSRWVIIARVELKLAVLTFSSGGIRGIIELEILRAIEECLGHPFQIKHFFDLIVGTRCV